MLAHQSPSPNSRAFTVRCEHIEREQLDLVIVLAGTQVVAVASTRLSVSLPGNRRSAPFVHAILVVNRWSGRYRQFLTTVQGISFVSNDATGPMTLRFHQPQR